MQETPETQSAGAGSLGIWRIPDRGLIVEFPPEVMERVLVEALSGLGLLSRGRGVETGGILLGWARQEGEIRRVRIEDFRPASCEHARGPAFMLSDKEEAELRRAAVSWAAKPGRRRYLVGFWRSHVRGPLSLRAEDLALLVQLKEYGCELALLVEPRGAGPGLAALFRPEGGSFQAGATAATFGIGPVQRGVRSADAKRGRGPAAGPDAPAGTDSPSPVAAKAGATGDFRFSMFEPSPPDRDGRRTGKRRLLAVAVLALAGAGAAGGWAVSRGHVRLPSWEAPRNPYALGLRVSHHGENLHLGWDPGCPAVELAGQGILVIADGDWMRVIELDKAQLRSGSAVYRPIGGRVSFRIELRWGRNSFSEAVEWEAR